MFIGHVGRQDTQMRVRTSLCLRLRRTSEHVCACVCFASVNYPTWSVFITTKNRDHMKTARCESKWHSLQFQRTKIAYRNHKIVLFPQEFNTCWLYKLRDPSSQTALVSSLSLLSSCYIMSCNWCCKNCPAGHVIRMCVHSLLGSYETCASPTACTSLAWYVGKTVKGSWAHNTSGVESGIMLPKKDVKKVLL